MRTLPAFIVALACLTPPLALADGSEPLLPTDNRIKLLMYDEADIYTVVTKYGYQTNIVFAPQEEVQTISMGDRSLWQIIPNANRLFIRPMEENVSTNMTVLTNRRSYQFDLKSLGVGKTAGNIYVAQFVYPDDKPRALPPRPPVAAQPPVIVAHAPRMVATGPGISRPLNPNYNYTYTGPDGIAPQQVYDDGRSTFIRYGNIGAQLPDAYIVEADGSQRPASYYVRDDAMIIDEVVGELVLKHEAGTVHVYNETMYPRP